MEDCCNNCRRAHRWWSIFSCVCLWWRGLLLMNLLMVLIFETYLIYMCYLGLLFYILRCSLHLFNLFYLMWQSVEQIGNRADRLTIGSDIYLYSSNDIEVLPFSYIITSCTWSLLIYICYLSLSRSWFDLNS